LKANGNNEGTAAAAAAEEDSEDSEEEEEEDDDTLHLTSRSLLVPALAPSAFTPAFASALSNLSASTSILLA
jgi:N-acetylmuramic acid 6-phosphate (MurNAc-6-P) etherase